MKLMLRPALFILILLTGVLLRISQISPFKFYPDAYQNLSVARNIITYRNVAGTLGTEGMQYPPYFMWSRPVYPLLIVSSDIIFKDLIKSSQTVSFLMGVLGIAVSYLLIRTVFKKEHLALAGALLTAVSFNHSLWSGYIMSDTTGILFSLMFWTLLFSISSIKSEIADVKDIFSGVLFSLAVFSRYEYILFLIPAAILLISKKVNLYKYINLLAGFMIMSSLIIAFLFPKETLTALIGQNIKLVYGSLVITVVSAAVYFIYRKTKPEKYETLFIRSKYLFYTLSLLPLFLFITGINIPYLTGLGNFLKSDVLLSTLFIAGLGLLMEDKNKRYLGILSLTFYILMTWVYANINPGMQRYTTHLLPFMLIPGVYAIEKIRSMEKSGFIISVIIAVTIVQLFLTYRGIKVWSADWNKKSYEETSALKLKSMLNNNEFVFAAMPEPYFIFTGHPVRGISEEKPYLYTGGLDDDREIVVVRDFALKDIFPGFYEFTAKIPKIYKIGEFKTDINYRYRDKAWPETEPVIIYKLTVKDYKGLIM